MSAWREVKATEDALRTAHEMLRSLGWVPFGEHADRPDVLLQFSEVTGEDGLPEFERVLS